MKTGVSSFNTFQFARLSLFLSALFLLERSGGMPTTAGKEGDLSHREKHNEKDAEHSNSQSEDEDDDDDINVCTICSPNYTLFRPKHP